MSTNLIKILNRQRRSKNKKNKFKMSAKSVNSVMLLRLLFYYSIALPRKLSFLCLRIKRRMSRLACRSVKFNFVLVNLNTEVHPGKSVSFSFLLFSRPHTALSLFTCLLFVFFLNYSISSIGISSVICRSMYHSPTKEHGPPHLPLCFVSTTLLC